MHDDAELHRQVLEEFHSGHSGSDVLTIALYVLHAPLLMCTLQYVRMYITGSCTDASYGATSNFSLTQLFEEMLIVVAPLILVMTLISEYLVESAMFLFSLNCSFYCIHQHYYYSNETMQSKTRTKKHSHKHKRSDTEALAVIGDFKGVVVLVTCLAILAVDFRIFPRAFSKTEHYGTSLMDVGTGLFVVSSALTSPFARKLRSSQQVNPRTLTLTFVILSGLGLSRTLATHVLGYHQHVSEYGQHWNFFVTLACVWALADAVHAVVKYSHIYSALGGALVGVVYQWVLLHNNGACTMYVFDAPRDTLFAQNREGVASMLGGLSVFLVGEGLAYYCFYSTQEISRKNLMVSVITCWLAWLVGSMYLQETSRRLNNFAYGTFTLAIAYSILLIMQVTRSLAPENWQDVCIFTAMRRVSLSVFLLANVLTGAINMSISTLDQGQWESVIIVSVYALVLIVFSCLLS